MNHILTTAVDLNASDVHLVAGKPPIFRVHGELVTAELPPITSDRLEPLLLDLITEKQRSTFEKNKELDFSYSGLENYQCRFNVYHEKGKLAATIRITPTKIEDILKFKLPPVMNRLAEKRSGLVIVSGTAGSGKSTTLTYMVDIINNTRKAKIITIEDPVEYIHESKKSLVVQREVGSDTNTFANALKYALRQDPDVVVVGEMRDYESVSMALTTAETGHLVLTTVHAPDSVETINRIIDVYPIGHRDQICAQLAGNLIGVISQTLVPKMGSSDRVLATEVLLTSISIRNLIRRGAFTELRGQLDSEEDPDIHTLENCLSGLVKDRIISIETAESYAKFPNMLNFSEHTDFSKEIKHEKKAVEDAKPAVGNINRKIFIIDGHENDVKNMKAVLKQVGFTEVDSAETGKDALEAVVPFRPDIIILDAAIYDIESFALCKQLKAIPAINSKIIMITSNLQPNDTTLAREAGADGFVVKTKAYELLIKSIDSIRQ